MYFTPFFLVSFSYGSHCVQLPLNGQILSKNDLKEWIQLLKLSEIEVLLIFLGMCRHSNRWSPFFVCSVLLGLHFWTRSSCFLGREYLAQSSLVQFVSSLILMLGWVFSSSNVLLAVSSMMSWIFSWSNSRQICWFQMYQEGVHCLPQADCVHVYSMMGLRMALIA